MNPNLKIYQVDDFPLEGIFWSDLSNTWDVSVKKFKFS